jgi:hypothetical protein
MASKKAPPSMAAKPPTLAPARATGLLQKQLEGARGLLTSAHVERLDFESWEQTTRAVLAGAFGEPSENIARFARASAAYPGRAGADERFWAQYRRDELAAKISSVESCVAQLEMGLGDSPEPGTTPKPPHPYEAARKVLQILHDIFLEHGHQSWSISPSKDGQDNFASVGLDEAGARKILRMLATKHLVKYVGQNAFVITDYGISACDHVSTLDHELPVGSPSAETDAQESRATGVDLHGLDNIEALIESDEIRDIVVRDLIELQAAIRFGLAKCTLLLGGTILEAVLVDVLDRNRALASSYMKKRRFPEEASLPDLIAIAGDAALLDAPGHLLTPTSVAIATAVTDHRDLIHPHAEARGRIRIDDATSRAVVHLLNVVVRDLVEAKKRGDIDAYVRK